MAAPIDHVSPCIIVFNKITDKIQDYVLPQPKIGNTCTHLIKTLYDQSHFSTSKTNSIVLPKLITDNFDDEQVWQQLELSNNAIVPQLLEQISKTIVKKKVQLVSPTHIKKPDISSEADDESSESDAKPSTKKTVKQKKLKIIPKIPKKSKKALSFEDKFFNVSQLENFLNREDAKEEKQALNQGSSLDEGSSDVDYFDDLPSGEESDYEGDEEEHQNDKPKKSAREATYDDFFDPPPDDADDTERHTEDAMGSNDSKEVSDMEYDTRDVEDEKGPSAEDLWANRHREQQPASDSASNSKEEEQQAIFKKPEPKGNKSPFQKLQEKLKETISEVEEANLSEKPWQLKGEVNAESRPENSLLEEHLQFDHLNKQAPVITEETTKTLEEIILQRIKDKAWDDVERKMKPKEVPFEYKRRVTLDQEKSKLSLAEVYEKEYIKQRENEKEEKQVPEHNVIRKAMTGLFSKLDALSNFHYMPKAPSSEIRIVNNLPAFTVEDVAPVTISDAGLLAPEEVKEKMRSELKGSTERSKTDQKRERRAKKLRQHKSRIAKESKSGQLKPSLQTKQSRNEAKKVKIERKGTKPEDQKKSAKSLNSSSAFFAKLQEKVHSEVQDHIKKKKITKLEKSQSFKL